MHIKKTEYFFEIAILITVILCLSTVTLGQGRGHGAGNGNGRGNAGGGAPSGIGVDRGLGNASDRSGGRSDNGLGTASNNSNGRSDAGIDRARIASDNLRRADDDLREHPGVPKMLHTNANALRSGYQAALSTNPNLKFGQYVAATRLGQNLGSRSPNITRDAILAGLASGNSLGRTLQNLGLSEREAKDAKKNVEREIKEAHQ